ncbi:HEAT repeat domain-containing protein [Pendulispora rubella]|uniref:HEAT repeat domain-containing protein n=1 Tax=Pendulispora rubella TaxID=2741070 RepID=A0ABZ2L558_9BACT
MTTTDAGWTIEELLQTCIAEALRGENDGEPYWQSVRALQARDPDEVWSRLEPVSRHEHARVRAVVPDVLRFLGQGSRPRLHDTVALFESMLRAAPAPELVASIGLALGELGAPEGVALMRPFAQHPNADVRFAVVSACLGQKDPAAIETLIALSADAEDHVRDWATFGLGTQVGPTEDGDEDAVDTQVLRDALAARLEDPHTNTRSEAIVGLAARRDPRVLPILQREIDRGPELSLILEAARWMASPSLYDGLRKLEAHEDPERRKFWLDNGLAEAIAACTRER